MSTGFSAVMGSWKIIDIARPRSDCRADGGASAISCPAKRIDPADRRTPSGSSPITASAAMLLPQPDSPTSARVRPASPAKDSSPSPGTARPGGRSSTCRPSTAKAGGGPLTGRVPAGSARR